MPVRESVRCPCCQVEGMNKGNEEALGKVSVLWMCTKRLYPLIQRAQFLECPFYSSRLHNNHLLIKDFTSRGDYKQSQQCRSISYGIIP